MAATRSSQKKKPPAKRRSTAKKSAKAPSRVGGTVGAALDGRSADVAGLALIGIGIIAGAGLYADVAGPIGQLLATASSGFAGLAGVLVPPVLVLIGIACLRDNDPQTGQGLFGRAHLVVGGVLLALAVTGLLHVLRGQPAFDAGVDEWGAAGGLLGMGTGAPLVAVAATGGAVVALLTFLAISFFVITRIPVRVAAEGAVSTFRPLGETLRATARSLFTLGDDPDRDRDRDRDRDGDRDRGPDVTVAGEPTTIYDLEDEPEPLPPEPVDETRADPVVEIPAAAPPTELDLRPAAPVGDWKLPPAKVLVRTGSQEVDRKAVEEDGRRLEASLAQHGVETRLIGMVVGPTVTRYELELGPGVKVNKVTSLAKDIAYNMATPDVRILAPIPGKQAIGIEVPNARRQLVTVGDILTSREAVEAEHPLEVAVGRDINGKSHLMNLAQMPHILIAGATGAGKSSCLNSILTSILMRSTPDQVRMILIDPKRVEMGQYEGLPHLLTQVVTNPKKAANALSWAVKEMERRYDLLSEVGVRDITGYNEAYDRGDLAEAESAYQSRQVRSSGWGDAAQAPAGAASTDAGGSVQRGETDAGGHARQSGPDRYERLPFIIVVVDELADLMMVAARDVEDSICRIAQMARAVGIHLIIATQRPSVNVITGVIKANVPARLAFAVSSATDSRVILDQVGAERLVGKGDMLFLGPTSSTPARIQGSWVTEEEVRSIAAHWKGQAPQVSYVEDVQGGEGGDPGAMLPGGGTGDDDDDDLALQAMELIVRSQLGSTSMLQRKLKVGFARAGRLMDILEQRGVVGPSIGSKARDVLMTEAELDDLLSKS
ncbi:DNA translocase FtsK [Acidimicrobiia bacterium EGI L10123]|uniref:DNA translocase FtsK n=1 Tax=Salinilacustrithrix flava TaxID=2957203 RepID=UPI003D7C328F|nr:DNA translocase FtsK [Acidimicrobiia bacterium EGI L10123]